MIEADNTRFATGWWRVGLVVLLAVLVSFASGCSALKKMREHAAQQEAKEQQSQQEKSEEPIAKKNAVKKRVEKNRVEKELHTGESVATQTVKPETQPQPNNKPDLATQKPSEVVVEEKPRNAVNIAEQQAQYLANTITQAMPLGALMEYSKRQDSAWPLGRFRHKLQQEQLDCVRVRMNQPAYEAYAMQKAQRFVLQNPDLVEEATATLDGGGARFLQLMSDSVLKKVSGQPTQTPDIATALSDAEKTQVIALLQKPRMQPLRSLVGISRIKNPKTGKTENNYTKRTTNTLALQALQQCGVDARALLAK